MVKELYQGRRQRLRGIEPRVRRRGAYVALRGLTNVLLRRPQRRARRRAHDRRGARWSSSTSSTTTRSRTTPGSPGAESLDALEGIDRVLGTLEKVAAAAPRPYRFVVAVRPRAEPGRHVPPAHRPHAGGRGAGAHRACPRRPLADTDDAEMWGPLNAMLTEVLSASKPTARWVRSRDGRFRGRARRRPHPAPAADRPELVVVGSATSGWSGSRACPAACRSRSSTSASRRLVPGLLAEHGVAFVVADSARGPLALGPLGLHVLADGVVEGVDPLGPFGPRAAADLVRVPRDGRRPRPVRALHARRPHRRGARVRGARRLPRRTRRMAERRRARPSRRLAAGSRPARPRPRRANAVLYGADAVHRQLVRWLERCGARSLAPLLGQEKR